jgi:hypothetical protein
VEMPFFDFILTNKGDRHNASCQIVGPILYDLECSQDPFRRGRTTDRTVDPHEINPHLDRETHAPAVV